jgi:serine/threonine protein kinase/Flp pilus assembly protein TadD
MTERDVFLEALDIKDPAQRAAFLDRACADQPDLRAQVEELLKAHELAGQFLDQPHPPGCGPTATYVPPPGTETAGMVIAGKYKLLQRIGEGGMGSVWMADQTEPVKRRVAIKLIRSEHGSSKTILSRFDAERQAIALMDHPHIAKLLDAGSTGQRDEGEGRKDEGSEGRAPSVLSSLIPHPSSLSSSLRTGRPFFVMELVKGVPLTEFCDEHKLSIAERLHLFMQICGAVQHAHQKGIIHRDLKPTNILVELHDDKPVPKVIDFGLAKALSGQPLTEHTLFTGFGTVAGTPLYMAPEQAKFNAIDIDTRADIYALGVILYELLTGSTPIERGVLKKAALDEVLRVIREHDPPAPSKRLSTTQSQPSVAANRHTEPEKLGRFVKGELDWIVMKALAKERDRRYETASGFSKDIERFLNHEPVLAGPPSASYRLRKFVRRNRAQVMAAALVLVALLIGIAGTTIGLIRAEQQRQAALANERKATEAAQAETQAKHEALDREAETRAVLDFVETRVFAAARPKDEAGGLGYGVKLADAVKAALPFVDKAFTGQPLIEARLRMTMGRSFALLGDTTSAIKQFQAARQLYTKHRGPDHPDTLDCMHSLAIAYDRAGRFREALQLGEETLRLQQAKLGPDHPDTLQSRCVLPGFYRHAGLIREALQVSEESLPLLKAKLGVDHPDTLGSMMNLANCYDDAGRKEEALRLREETLELQKAKLGPNHRATLTSMNNLACSYIDVGRTQEALQLLQETVQLRKTKLGPDHPDTLASMTNLANCYDNAGRKEQALHLREQILQAQKAKLGRTHRETLESMDNLANSYLAAGRVEESVTLREETFRLFKAELGVDHPTTLLSMNNLAASYLAAGRTHEALKLLEETVRLRQAKLGPNHPDTRASLRDLGECFSQLGRWKEAAATFDRISELDPTNHWTWYSAATLHLGAGDIESYRRICRDMLKRFGDTDSAEIAERTAKTCLLLPNAVTDFDRVLKLADRAVTGTEWMGGFRWFVFDKGLAEYRAGRHGEAVKWLERYAPDAGGGHIDATAFAMLAMAQHRLGRDAQARVALDRAQIIVFEKMPDPARGQRFAGWLEWLHCQALLREAEAMLKPEDARVEVNRGIARARQRKLDDAIACFRKAIEFNPQYAPAHRNLGISFRKQKKWREAVACYQKAIECDPNDHTSLNEAAWILAAGGDLGLRHPAESLKLARRATELKPGEGTYWNTLGVAHYRAGNWKEAVTALERSQALRKGGDSFDWFFLAMAHWQLGEKEPAHTDYLRGVQWLEKNQPKNEELRRLRTEAGKLLEIKKG